MAPPRNRELLVKVARMYYLDGRSQQEIAAVVGSTRSNVSRMLTAARDEGIVEIRVVDGLERAGDLEAALCRRFALREARVLRFAPRQERLAGIGELAAGWLLETLDDGQVLALSWGTALQSMVWSVRTQHPVQVEIVQLVGGLSAVSSAVTGQELVRELADRLGAGYRYLHAPALLESPAALDALLGERSVAEALDAARSADVAVVGIGGFGVGSSADIVAKSGLSPAEIHRLAATGVAGDVCGRFFDAAGAEVESPLHDRVLAVSLEDLRAIPTVAGLAAGREKARGVLGALCGRILDVLICDEHVARAVLAEDGAGS